MSDPAPTLAMIVGIGNPMRSDDGVGPWVAGAMGAVGFPACVHAGDGTGLLDLFDLHADLVLVDATRSGAAPGTLVTLDAAAGPLVADLFHYSTHRFGLAEAVETARALGALPRRLMIYGIEGQAFGAGIGLSPPVAATAVALVATLTRAGAILGDPRRAVPITEDTPCA